MIPFRRDGGLTLIEILTVIAIIAVLAGVVVIATGGARLKARDTKRKSDLAQFGRMLQSSCYMPDDGAGQHDLSIIVEELKVKFPQYAKAMARTPKDPKTGSDFDTGYTYTVTADGKKCAFYANLEYKEEEVTLELLTAPTAGGGSGVLNATGAPGRNGTTLYFQVSN
ncbi:MAG: type II secretion system protein [Patescibacteria group bacterium]|nr:type II secretion system protein [Patescibacteria group bacterium]